MKDLFDWIGGTSTGGLLALALAMGRDLQHCLGLYFRLKDDVFIGQRPYSAVPLEATLVKEFGEDTTMADIKGAKIFVTGVLADRNPPDLHLFRNYLGGEDLIGGRGTGRFQNPPAYNSQLVWQAARATGAAPSYFPAYGRLVHM